MSHVYIMWCGPRPPYIDICMRTIRQNCLRTHCFNLIDDSNIEAVCADAHPNWRKIPEKGVLSDVVRACCLAKQSGWYIDADTVLLKPLPVIPEGIDAAYVTWSQPPHRIVAGNIYVSKEVGQKWLENINARLAAGKWGWTQLGEGCITPVIDALHEDRKLCLPLDTFFPIEIDLNKGMGSAKFFHYGKIDNLITENTVAIGLNNSWFASRPQAHRTYVRINRGLYNDGTYLSSVMSKAVESLRQPHVTVCCPTFRRPELLAKMKQCFERQTYQERFLSIVEDGCDPKMKCEFGDRWQYIPTGGLRFETLSRKRNWNRPQIESDIIVPWDDDDLYLPHAIQAIVDALQWADFARPSQILVPGAGRTLQPYETFWRADKFDKACHPAWGYTVGAFNAVGGYPAELSHGEDLGLAKRFRDAGISECDPIVLGHRPYMLYGPHGNEHFGWFHKDYATWPEKLAASREKPPGDWDLTVENIKGPVLKRSFVGDWYGSDQR